MKRIAEIDGLRALAALSVFVFHSFGLPKILRFTGAGWIGVDLFFVISGYLITTILLGMREDPHYFKNFYMRRTLRIFPPYYLYFVLCLACALAYRNYQWSGRLWTAFALYGTSLVAPLPWYPRAMSNLPGPARALDVTWSLSIEELFYLLWAPAVRYLKKPFLFVLVLGAILAAPLVRWYVHTPGTIVEYYFFPARIDTIAFGCLLALIRNAGAKIRVQGWQVVCGLVLCASILWLPGDPRENGLFVVGGYTLIALTMALVLNFVLDHAGSNHFACRALRNNALVGVGTISYMFYLLHLFVIKAFNGALSNALVSDWMLNRIIRVIGSLVATLALALLSWKYFESPILRLKSRFTPRPGHEEAQTQQLHNLELVPAFQRDVDDVP